MARSIDGVGALRQRIFFAGDTLAQALGARAAGEGRPRQIALRQSVVLHLYAAWRGVLADICRRHRVDAALAGDVETVRVRLAARGEVSPELERLAQLLGPGGWLADCLAECALVLGERLPSLQEDALPEDVEEDARVGRLSVAPATLQVQPLDDADVTRLRGWIAGWKGIADEQLVGLEEF